MLLRVRGGSPRHGRHDLHRLRALAIGVIAEINLLEFEHGI